MNLTAYFDASGANAGQTAFAVGGWISTVEKWTQFNFAWKEMLAQYGAKIFHAADLESRKNEYDDWTEDQKIAFQRDAFTIIHRCATVAVSSAVVKADFETHRLAVENYKLGSTAAYYNFCVIDCLRNIERWADRHNYDGPIAYVFELGDLGGPGAKVGMERTIADPKTQKRYRIGSCAFVKKAEASPLQAADIWAYEICKHVENQVVGKGRIKERRSYNFLWHPRYREFNTYWNSMNLPGWIKQYLDET